jgi:hypothetical protein
MESEDSARSSAVRDDIAAALETICEAIFALICFTKPDAPNLLDKAKGTPLLYSAPV